MWVSLRVPIEPVCQVTMVGTGNIAVIANRDGVDSQSLLAEAAAEWRSRGVRVVGVIARDHDAGDGSCSAGFLQDIVSGNRFSIHLDAAPAGTACHLDAGGVDCACAGLLPQIPSGDIVVLSKFGKLEAARQGLRAAFEAAIATGKPVLTTVSPRHADAWEVFAPTALRLTPDMASLDRWWRTMRIQAWPAE